MVRVTGKQKALWQNIVVSVRGRMLRHDAQKIAACKLFSDPCFLSEGKTSAGKDQKQVKLRHIQNDTEGNCSTVAKSSPSG